MKLEPETIETVLEIVRGETTLDFSGYRRPLLICRIQARAARLGVVSVDDYIRILQDNPEESPSLADAIAINVSTFFRNPLVFAVLQEVVLPEMIARKQAVGAREIRVWSAGCAAGEVFAALTLFKESKRSRNVALSLWRASSLRSE